MSDHTNASRSRLWRRIGLATLGASLSFSLVASEAIATPAPVLTRAEFSGEVASQEARQLADWVVRTQDNQGGPFIIVDKKATKVFVFDSRSNLQGATTALLGLARGDETAPGIGALKLSDIPPAQRTTPAGRFVASLGLNLANQDILWVDYDSALALHRVLSANSSQHRLERLEARSASDRRITFGCINVPVAFYEAVVRPQFVGTTGIVYILPETRPLKDVFFAEQPTRAG